MYRVSPPPKKKLTTESKFCAIKPLKKLVDFDERDFILKFGHFMKICKQLKSELQFLML